MRKTRSPRLPLLWLAVLAALFTSSVRAESLVFVFSEDAAAVTVHDARTLALLASPTVDRGARQALGIPDQDYPGRFRAFYVVTSAGLQVLTAEFRSDSRIELPEPTAAGPLPAALLPRRGAILVAAGERVYWVDTATRGVVTQFEVGFETAGVVVAPGGGRAFVFSRVTREIAVIDLDRRRLSTDRLWLPEAPRHWAAAPDGAVLAAAGDAIYRVDRLVAASTGLASNASSSAAPGLGIGSSGIGGLAAPGADRFAALLGGRLLTGEAVDFKPRADSVVALAASAEGDIFIAEAGEPRLIRLAGAGDLQPLEAALAATPSAISLVEQPVEQTVTGSLIQQFGDNQTVEGGAMFQVGVRALTAAGAPMVGLAVAVSAVLPAGNVVVCQPSVTDSGGTATLHCTASGVGEDTELEITVSDALGRQAPPFRVQVERAEIIDGLRSLSGDTLTTPRGNVFQFVVQAAAEGRPQPGLELTVEADPGFPLLACPSLMKTDINGLANVLCRAGGVDAPAIAAVSVRDPFGRRVELTVVIVPHVTIGDGPHKAAGDGQTMPRFGVLATPLVVTALEGGLPREKVQLDVSTSSGLLFCPSVVFTDPLGQARIICSSGQTSTTNFIKVFVRDPEERGLASPFVVTVVPINPGSAEDLVLQSADTLTGPVGVAMPDAIRVLAVDGGGGDAPGAPIFLSAVGEVLFDPSVAVSDQRGEAAVSLVPGCPAREEIVGIGLSSGAPLRTVALSITPGPPRIISKIRGDLQGGAAGELLNRDALVVEITDICGDRLQGLPVEWAVNPPDAAELVNVIAVTDGNGRSSSLARLGQRAGRFTVTARSGDLAVVFNLAVTQVPSAVEGVSGDGQRAAIGTEAPEPLTVRVIDQDGGPIAGLRVRFSVTAGQATLSRKLVRTDAQGRASVVVRAGDQVGRVNVTAAVVPEIAAVSQERGTAQSVLFFIFTLDVTGGPPVVSSNAFVNGASFQLGWTPGSIGTIFGRGLLEGVEGIVQAGPAPFPTSLRGARVTVNGVPAPIVGVARMGVQEQINLQIPFEVAAGPASIVLDNNGAVTTVPGVAVNPVQPGIFQVPDGESFVAAALHVNFTPVTRARPAAPGEPILLFLTGLGPVTPAVATNAPGPNPPATTLFEPVVGLDDRGMRVLGSFYAPSLIGTYQVNFVVAPDVRRGDHKLNVVVDGVVSQDVTLPVGIPVSVDPN